MATVLLSFVDIQARPSYLVLKLKNPKGHFTLNKDKRG